MTSKERVIGTIKLEKPDRIHIDILLDPTFEPPAHEWLTVSYDSSFHDPNKFYLGVGSIFFHRIIIILGMIERRYREGEDY